MKIALVAIPSIAFALGACSDHGPHPSDTAPPAVQAHWRESQASLKALAARMPTLALPAAGGSFDAAVLRQFAASERHGASDQRLLSRWDSAGRRVVSDGPLARVVAVKGIEYKSQADFGASAYPIAIIYVDSASAANQYAKLGLKAGTNYWIVKYDSASGAWSGWVQPASGPAVHLETSAGAKFDPVEPVTAARFVWDSTDETLWGLCGGKCCSSTTRLPD
jgi:hypothetical protein